MGSKLTEAGVANPRWNLAQRLDRVHAFSRAGVSRNQGPCSRVDITFVETGATRLKTN